MIFPDPNAEIIILGDFNICFISENDHKLIKALENIGFQQIVKSPTHEEGRLIDHVYVKNPSKQYKIINQSLPYLDHDVIHVISES